MNEIANARVEPGCVEEVKGILDGLNVASVFLVVDREAYEASATREVLEPQLASYDVVVFDNFVANPKYQDVTRGVELFWENPCDVVMAVGGGSAIDMGKLIGFSAAQPAAPVVVMTNLAQIRYRPKPFIAIPTTAGTGSEATHFAVVYVDGRKYSVAHEWILPSYAFVDPELMANLPPSITAHTGLDALCQAMESVWSVNSTDVSLSYAREALDLVCNHLVNAVNAPTPGARWAMCRAAHLAGKAINIGKTTAPHALSYVMTSQFGVPHGLAVALTLGAMMVYNDGVEDEDVCDERGVGFVRTRIRELCEILGVDDAEGARVWLDDLMGQTGCPTRLSEVGMTVGDVEGIVENVNVERLANNPRRLTPEGIRNILQGLL